MQPIRHACSGLLVAGALALHTGRVHAQDDRYWRQTYGTEATLLNGAVIGRATDIGTVFYNPAGLATIKDPTILLSGHVYEYEKIGAVGESTVLGEPLAVGNGSIKAAPSFFGGTVPWAALGKHRLGYSVLTRQTGDARIPFRTGADVDAGIVRLEWMGVNDLSEVWVGPTWAWPASERLSIGASIFVAVRSQYLRQQLTGQTLATDGSVGLMSYVREFDYYKWRLVPKLGATYDLGAVTLGATVTLPSVGLFGGGTALYNSTSTGIDFTGDGVPDPTFASSFQKDLPVTFKNGVAAGVGAGIDLSAATTLFISAEWYGPVGPYEVVQGLPFDGQSDGISRTNPLIHQARAIVNGAVGVRHRFSPTLAGYLSGATDFSAADTTFDVSLSKTLWDLYHAGAGAQLRVGRTELVLGLAYTWGGETVGVAGPPQAPDLIPDSVEFTQRGIRLIFGFQYSFSGDGGADTGSNAP